MAKVEFVRLPVLYVSWPQLRDDLKSLASKETRGLDALEEVLENNDKWGNIRLPLGLLRSVLGMEKICTLEHFHDVLLPWLAQTALQAEQLFKDSEYKLQNLYSGRAGEVVLTRRQVCCLLCLAFFNSFEPQQGGYEQFTLSDFLSFNLSKSQKNKLLCLLNYFERIRQSEEAKEEEFLSMRVCMSRRHVDPEDVKETQWGRCEKPLLPFESLDDGMIENAHGCLQVDFANAYIGGGVLGMGCLQEEIRFVINPECLVSILLCEEMEELESILITGTEQFSSYTGYGGKFIYTGPHNDNPVDECKRCPISIVAMDAKAYSGLFGQFEKRDILRDLNKAYCGFTHIVAGDDPDARTLIPVATGNWGCGAFGGDKRLKTFIQWLAASRAGRAVKYYTFNDTELCQKQREITERILHQGMTVGDLYRLLVSDNKKKDVFEYLSACTSSVMHRSSKKTVSIA